MQALQASDVLTLWERGAARHPLDRSALLAAAARPELPAHAVVDLPLGAVNAGLLELRIATFGTVACCHADCGHCGERLEFEVDCPALLQSETEDATSARVAEVAGLRVRAPSLRDLAAVAHCADATDGARRLLARCTLSGDGAQASDEALHAVERALEACDPNADLQIVLRCVACGHETGARLDAGTLLWDEIEARARALLNEVHQLARAYGWSEAEILALSPARRATYLAMVGA